MGIDSNKVVVKVKRMGGAFGGKETRSVFLTAALSVAARKLGVPVRCMLSREEDMCMTGIFGITQLRSESKVLDIHFLQTTKSGLMRRESFII